MTTFLGSTTSGSTDGQGTSARLYKPYNIALTGAAGGSAVYMYVADTFNHKIRAVTAAGVVTTLVGGGAGGATPGSAQGVGTACLFRYPYGLAVMASGDVLVADNQNDRIRLVSPDGLLVTTLAGGGATGVLAGTADGQGTNALLSRPYHLVVGPAGTVFFTDSYNHRVRVIDADGTVTTLAGGGNTQSLSGYLDGVGSNARFNFPYGLDISPSGDTLFVADALNSMIRAVSTSTGTVTTFAGGGGTANAAAQYRAGHADGVGTNAMFNQVASVVVGADGQLFVGDSGNHRLRTISPGGVVSSVMGGGLSRTTAGYANSYGTAALFAWPWGVAYDPAGVLYVADMSNNVIRVIAPVAPTAPAVPATPSATKSGLPSRSPSAAASASATTSATGSASRSSRPSPSSSAAGSTSPSLTASGSGTRSVSGTRSMTASATQSPSSRPSPQ